MFSKPLVFLSLLASSAHSFAPMAPTMRSSTQLAAAARPDTSSAVEEALKVTATFGVHSKEAAAAWDAVEEMDASDNSEATKASLAEECDVDNVSQECLDYGNFLDELVVLRDAIGKHKGTKASLADTLKMIKLEKPQAAPAHGHNSPELLTALEEAKRAVEKHGATSPEARLAWETYEEIAASGNENAVGINLMEECSIESGQDACRAMEEMDRILPVLLAISLPPVKQ